ncbi:MAG: Rrf2 family transcriptional regulator [Chloroflexota bacterium]
MFQVSRRADYAVRMMLELGLGEEDQRLTAGELSERTGVPKPFLHQITADLVAAGLLKTFAGPAGGLALARPPAKITMQQILEAVEGPICLNVCLVRPRECPRDVICPAHDFWGGLQRLVVQQLREATLDKLVIEARSLRQRPRPRGDMPYLHPEPAVIHLNLSSAA